MSCTCNSSQRRAISPLKGWLARSTNELRYLAAKLASQHSCGWEPFETVGSVLISE
jgi:hypothetical protein